MYSFASKNHIPRRIASRWMNSWCQVNVHSGKHQWKPKQSTFRLLSSDASATSNTSAPKAKSVGDHFLDNIGKVFFMGIGLIIGALVRSSKGNSNRIHIREELENIKVTILDPVEIDELVS